MTIDKELKEFRESILRVRLQEMSGSLCQKRLSEVNVKALTRRIQDVADTYWRWSDRLFPKLIKRWEEHLKNTAHLPFGLTKEVFEEWLDKDIDSEFIKWAVDERNRFIANYLSKHWVRHLFLWTITKGMMKAVLKEMPVFVRSKFIEHVKETLKLQKEPSDDELVEFLGILLD